MRIALRKGNFYQQEVEVNAPLEKLREVARAAKAAGLQVDCFNGSRQVIPQRSTFSWERRNIYQGYGIRRLTASQRLVLEVEEKRAKVRKDKIKPLLENLLNLTCFTDEEKSRIAQNLRMRKD